MWIEIADRPVEGLDGADLLTGPDAKAANSFEQPEVVTSRPFAAVEIAEGVASVHLPPLSMVAMTLRLSS